MTEKHSSVLKDIRNYLRCMGDINVRISRGVTKGDYELLLKALDDREAVLGRLKTLRKEIERMKEIGTQNCTATFEEKVIIREICQLSRSLVSQGEEHIEAIRHHMECIEGKLQEIRRGKRVLGGYRGRRREGRGAVYIG